MLAISEGNFWGVGIRSADLALASDALEYVCMRKKNGADQKLQVPAPADPIPQLMLSYNFYCCRLQIPLMFGSAILPNLPTRVFVCLLKVVICLPSLPSE